MKLGAFGRDCTTSHYRLAGLGGVEWAMLEWDCPPLSWDLCRMEYCLRGTSEQRTLGVAFPHTLLHALQRESLNIYHNVMLVPLPHNSILAEIEMPEGLSECTMNLTKKT